jgi:hypothetical protein
LPVDEYVERYRAFDADRNDGKGYSDSSDAAQLGWGESYVLADYMYLWRVTGDGAWLVKVRDHADAVFASMSDHDGDGYSGWQTDRYSVAHARLVGGDASLDVQERIADIAAAHAVTGDTYRLRFADDGAYTVENDATGERSEHSVNEDAVAGVPGVHITATTLPTAGRVYTVETTAVSGLEYVIHEGMLLYPLALFIEAAMDGDDADMQTAAERYLGLIGDNFVPKWDRCWVDVAPGRGAYAATDSPAERTPGRVLPHNQYAMHAQAYMALDRFLPSLGLRDRAERMATNFQACLRQVGDAYEWNYWDWEDGHSGPEDSSHAAINVGFVIEGARRGVVFDAEDATRVARTLLDVMWNGSLGESTGESTGGAGSDPVVGDRVDTNEGDTYFTLRRWAELSAYDPIVWDVCLAMFRKRGELPTDIPTMLHAKEGLTDE